MKYPTENEIIEFNKKVLKDIKIKKGDKHEVVNRESISLVINSCKSKTDVYDGAVCLLKGLIQSHSFKSGNRRVAFGITRKFIEDNNVKFNIENSGKEAGTLRGIREGYYKDEEIKDWLKNGKIRKFER